MPLDVVYTKSTSIWDDIVPFIDKLVAGYKQSQENKWNNEWMLSAITDIEKANKPDKVNSFLEMQKIPEENLDIEGFKGFADKAVNMLTMKEMEMNPEDFVQPSTDGQPTQQQPKMIPDKMEWGTLYKMVSELPTGKVDWTNTMDIFKERLESGRTMNASAQQFLNTIMGESMPTNQRQKVQQDFEFTKDIKNTLYPETVSKTPNSELEYWLQEHPNQGVEDYWKAKAGDDTAKIDIKELLENSDEWEIGSINAKGEPTLKRKDTTKKADFKTYDEAQKWVKENPQPGYQYKIDPKPEGFDVLPEKTPVTPQGGTDKLVPTYNTIQQVIEDLESHPDDYESIMHNANLKYDFSGAALPSEAEILKGIYNQFEGRMIQPDPKDPDEQYMDEQGMVKNPEAYADFYQDYERFAKKYFDLTGEILPKKYLSIEEAGKYTTAQWATGKWKGGAKPVRNEDGIPWSWEGDIDSNQIFYNEFQRTNQELIKAGKAPLTMQDINWAGLSTEPGIDIEKLKKLIMNQ